MGLFRLLRNIEDDFITSIERYMHGRAKAGPRNVFEEVQSRMDILIPFQVLVLCSSVDIPLVEEELRNILSTKLTLALGAVVDPVKRTMPTVSILEHGTSPAKEGSGSVP